MSKVFAILAVVTALGAVSANAQSMPNPNCGEGTHYDNIIHSCVQNTGK